MLLLLAINLILPLVIAFLFFTKRLAALGFFIITNTLLAVASLFYHLFFFLPIK